MGYVCIDSLIDFCCRINSISELKELKRCFMFGITDMQYFLL